MHTKRAYENDQIKVLGEFRGVHVQSDTLLLADVFEKFQNMCLKIYKIDSIKKTKIRLNLAIDIANNKYMKKYDKKIESSYIQYWDLNILYGLVVPQKLPVNNLF